MQCRITALDGEWDGPVPMTYNHGTWRASGTVTEWASFVCQGPEPTDFLLQLRILSGKVVDQVWMADQVAGSFAKSSPETACLAGHLSWDISGRGQ
jgi:hypothetical protein